MLASPVAQLVKNLPTNAGASRDTGSIPGSRRFPGEGNGKPLQYSCLENPMNRGAFWATVHGGCKETDITEQLILSLSLYNHEVFDLRFEWPSAFPYFLQLKTEFCNKELMF